MNVASKPSMNRGLIWEPRAYGFDFTYVSEKMS